MASFDNETHHVTAPVFGEHRVQFKRSRIQIRINTSGKGVAKCEA